MKKRNILDGVERELRALLLVDLPRVAAGDDSLYFYNVDYNPFQLPESRLSSRGCEAYRLAHEIQRLRAALGETSISEASLLLESVRGHADRADPHGLGSKRLAERLIQQLADLRLTDAG